MKKTDKKPKEEKKTKKTKDEDKKIKKTKDDTKKKSTKKDDGKSGDKKKTKKESDTKKKGDKKTTTKKDEGTTTTSSAGGDTNKHVVGAQKWIKSDKNKSSVKFKKHDAAEHKIFFIIGGEELTFEVTYPEHTDDVWVCRPTFLMLASIILSNSYIISACYLR